jgi:superfamily I DNA/RNA helicase
LALPKPVGRQADVVYLPAKGHQVVLGTAGTGKTVMAIHRAAHLADSDTPNYGPVLLITFNRSLVTYLKYLAADHADGITIETYATFARGYLDNLGRMRSDGIASSRDRIAYLRQALQQVSARYPPTSAWFFDKPESFFLDELDWIEGHGLQDVEQYIAAERVGRMVGLRSDARKAVWRVREQYRAVRASAGKLYDWSSLAAAVRAGLAEDQRFRMYRHVVVDEAQDLSPEAIRSLVDAVQPGGSVTLFGDYAQQIYGRRVSWRSCGLQVKKHEVFTENYRNTAAIAALAISMSELPHFKDSSDLVVPVAPVAAGAKPTLVRCNSEAEEISVVRERAAADGKYARVAVLARSRADARRATADLSGVRMLTEEMRYWKDTPGVYAGTYHSGKGLEFDVVILPFCSSDRLPDPEVVEAFGQAEAASRESRLLYVGVTRARTELLVTYTGTLTTLLPDPSSSVWTVGEQ